MSSSQNIRFQNQLPNRERPQLLLAFLRQPRDRPHRLHHPRDRVERRAQRIQPHRQPLGLPAWHPRQLFDGVGEDWSGWHVEACRSHERLNERAQLPRVLFGPVERYRQRAGVLLERVGHVQQTAALFQQVVEVKRPFLRAGVLRDTHRNRRGGRRCRPRSARWC